METGDIVEPIAASERGENGGIVPNAATLGTSVGRFRDHCDLDGEPLPVVVA